MEIATSYELINLYFNRLIEATKYQIKIIQKKDFDFIGNNTFIKDEKPAPDIYIKALNSLELESSECIAIEDTVESALSAHKAQIRCIAFPGLFHIEDDFSFCIKKLDKLNISIFN